MFYRALVSRKYFRCVDVSNIFSQHCYFLCKNHINRGWMMWDEEGTTIDAVEQATQFDERKVAQIAAYLLKKADGCKMPHMKLLKLMYLADRQSYASYGKSMTGDRAYSMRYGPVLDRTFDLINGNIPFSDCWDSLISARAGHEIALKTPDEAFVFDKLQSPDTEILDNVFSEFGHLDQWVLSTYTHTFPEWERLDGGRSPIAPSKIIEAVLKGTKRTTQEIIKDIEWLPAATKSPQTLDRALASMLGWDEEGTLEYAQGMRERYGI